jgi:hypothetical protein
MGAQLPARWSVRSERPISMPNCTMDRLEGAVAGQLQCLVRWLVAWRALLREGGVLHFKVDAKRSVGLITDYVGSMEGTL